MLSQRPAREAAVAARQQNTPVLRSVPSGCCPYHSMLSCLKDDRSSCIPYAGYHAHKMALDCARVSRVKYCRGDAMVGTTQLMKNAHTTHQPCCTPPTTVKKVPQPGEGSPVLAPSLLQRHSTWTLGGSEQTSLPLSWRWMPRSALVPLVHILLSAIQVLPVLPPQQQIPNLPAPSAHPVAIQALAKTSLVVAGVHLLGVVGLMTRVRGSPTSRQVRSSLIWWSKSRESPGTLSRPCSLSAR